MVRVFFLREKSVLKRRISLRRQMGGKSHKMWKGERKNDKKNKLEEDVFRS